MTARDPMSVLRHMSNRLVFDSTSEAIRDYQKAIAQVEALVVGMRNVLNVSRGTSGRIILELEDEERARACLAPFAQQECNCASGRGAEHCFVHATERML